MLALTCLILTEFQINHIKITINSVVIQHFSIIPGETYVVLMWGYTLKKILSSARMEFLWIWKKLW